MSKNIKEVQKKAAEYAQSLHGEFNTNNEDEWSDSFSAFLEGWFSCEKEKNETGEPDSK